MKLLAAISLSAPYLHASTSEMDAVGALHHPQGAGWRPVARADHSGLVHHHAQF